jgi:hypothetical protein
VAEEKAMNALRDFIDFVAETWPPFAIGFALLGLFGWLLVAAAKGDAQARVAFMAECEQHRPKYECTALWRVGESQTTVVPMPVVIR